MGSTCTDADLSYGQGVPSDENTTNPMASEEAPEARREITFLIPTLPLVELRDKVRTPVLDEPLEYDRGTRRDG